MYVHTREREREREPNFSRRPVASRPDVRLAVVVDVVRRTVRATCVGQGLPRIAGGIQRGCQRSQHSIRSGHCAVANRSCTERRVMLLLMEVGRLAGAGELYSSTTQRQSGTRQELVRRRTHQRIHSSAYHVVWRHVGRRGVHLGRWIGHPHGRGRFCVRRGVDKISAPEHPVVSFVRWLSNERGQSIFHAAFHANRPWHLLRYHLHHVWWWVSERVRHHALLLLLMLLVVVQRHGRRRSQQVLGTEKV